MQTSLRDKIKAGTLITGTMVHDFACPAIAPVLAEAGFDFIIIDQEHGPACYQDIQDVVIAAKSYDLAIIVRSTKNDYEYMAKVLDMGADGLLVPHVDTPAESHNVVKCTKYPPAGERSHGMRHYLSKFGPCGSTAEYIKVANEKTTILVQAESPVAARNIDAIVSSPWIDGVVVGPSDFTMSMGIIGQYDNPQFLAHCDTILQACLKAKKHFGIHWSKLDVAMAWKKKGANIMLFSSATNLLREKAIEVAGRLRSAF
ncbi:MAG: HpcH/HpaI aldolase/citrate lyase family protein [Candidatus Sigynarchaeota archaeon]